MPEARGVEGISVPPEGFLSVSRRLLKLTESRIAFLSSDDLMTRWHALCSLPTSHHWVPLHRFIRSEPLTKTISTVS